MNPASKTEGHQQGQEEAREEILIAVVSLQQSR